MVKELVFLVFFGLGLAINPPFVHECTPDFVQQSCSGGICDLLCAFGEREIALDICIEWSLGGIL